jgi:hypothetical protein
MEWSQWMVHLTMLDDGSVACSLKSYLPGKREVELLRGRWSDSDTLFQELLTLLDSSIWSSLADHQVKHGIPTLGGYVA